MPSRVYKYAYGAEPRSQRSSADSRPSDTRPRSPPPSAPRHSREPISYRTREEFVVHPRTTEYRRRRDSGERPPPRSVERPPPRPVERLPPRSEPHRGNGSGQRPPSPGATQESVPEWIKKGVRHVEAPPELLRAQTRRAGYMSRNGTQQTCRDARASTSRYSATSEEGEGSRLDADDGPKTVEVESGRYLKPKRRIKMPDEIVEAD